MNLVKNVELAIEKADKFQTKLHPHMFALPGLTGVKIQIVLNELMSDPSARYLEIGMFRGKTFCSALDGNKPAAAIGVEIAPTPSLGAVLRDHASHYPYKVYEANCWKMNRDLIKDINVYLYDGDHSPMSHAMAIKHFIPCLAKQSVILIDDWYGICAPNGDGRMITKEATEQGLLDSGLKVLYKRECRGPNNPNIDWWNGLGIFVVEKP